MCRSIVFTALTGFVCGALFGCQTSAEHQGAIKPSVTIRAHKGLFGGGLTFTSNKDDTYEIASATYNPKTGEFGLTGFKVRQDSPAVIQANVAQLSALVPLREQEIRFQAQVGANIAACLATINQGIAMGGEAGARLITAGITALNGLSGSIMTPVGGGSFEFRSPAGTTPPIPVKVTPAPTDSQPSASLIKPVRTRALVAADDEPVWLTPHDTGCDQAHTTTCTSGRVTVVPDPEAAPIENPEL